MEALQHCRNHWAVHGQQGAAGIHKLLVALRCLGGHAQLCQAVAQGGKAHALQQRACHMLVLQLWRVGQVGSVLLPPLPPPLPGTLTHSRACKKLASGEEKKK